MFGVSLVSADPSLREVRMGNARLAIHTALPPDWVAAAWNASGSSTDRVTRRPLPADTLTAVARAWSAQGQSTPLTGRAVVKRYDTRQGHNLWRRLLPGRAWREASGYHALDGAGITVPPLLVAGEERRLGLHTRGLLVTAELDAPTLARHVHTDGASSVLPRVMDVLARLHGAGLAHGDALLRNWLDAEPQPIPFDLPSWRRATTPAVRRDLVRVLGSARRQGARPDEVRDALHAWCARAGGAGQAFASPAAEQSVLTEAENFVHAAGGSRPTAADARD